MSLPVRIISESLRRALVRRRESRQLSPRPQKERFIFEHGVKYGTSFVKPPEERLFF